MLKLLNIKFLKESRGERFVVGEGEVCIPKISFMSEQLPILLAFSIRFIYPVEARFGH